MPTAQASDPISNSPVFRHFVIAQTNLYEQFGKKQKWGNLTNLDLGHPPVLNIIEITFLQFILSL